MSIAPNRHNSRLPENSPGTERENPIRQTVVEGMNRPQNTKKRTLLMKIAFFVAATVTALGAAAISGTVIIGVGFLTGMPPAAFVIAAVTVATAAFSVTIAVWALAATLFFNPSTVGAAEPQAG